ncbi:MAG: hypothetical protein KBS89_00515 [Bacteroidales bacterium]|nr:hypothetical protein [Candidatus Egerieousia equi]
MPVAFAARAAGGLSDVTVTVPVTVRGYLMNQHAVMMPTRMTTITVMPQRSIQAGLRPMMSCTSSL